MSFMARPTVRHPKLPVNDLGLTVRDYEGGMSTLCAGCGHDSVTAALVQTFFELELEPHMVAKLSGIGCSSKTPTYFLSEAHGFNSVHGRMPSIAAGANAANQGMSYVGISGDGDSLSIGLGQFCHAVRRNVDMVYVLENNGVYGLTKGQFSASADIGSKSKKGEVNQQGPIDPVNVALTLGATFVARSFSGDKQQLVPLIKAGLSHKGFALIDVLSPCVTFNDHEDSTKSYAFTRQFYHPAVHTDFVPHAEAIEANYDESGTANVTLHDGSHILLRKVNEKYDPHDKASVLSFIEEQAQIGEHPTGLLYIDEKQPEFHEINKTVAQPLNLYPYEELCPGSETLAQIMSRYQ
jgi:2-oxoglutarate ferredoxin oxidoreductase subunit beta